MPVDCSDVVAYIDGRLQQLGLPVVGDLESGPQVTLRLLGECDLVLKQPGTINAAIEAAADIIIERAEGLLGEDGPDEPVCAELAAEVIAAIQTRFALVPRPASGAAAEAAARSLSLELDDYLESTTHPLRCAKAGGLKA